MLSFRLVNNPQKLFEKERLVEGILHGIILFLFVYAYIATNGILVYFNYFMG